MSQVRRDMLEHMSTEAERFQGPNKKVKYSKIDVRDIETSGETSAKPCREPRQQVVKLAGPQTSAEPFVPLRTGDVADVSSASMIGSQLSLSCKCGKCKVREIPAVDAGRTLVFGLGQH